MDFPDIPDPGKRIALYRQRRGLTQRQLAAAVGVTPGYISMMERGDAKVVNVATLIAMARALRTRPQDLYPPLDDPAFHPAPTPDADRLATLVASIPGLVGFLNPVDAPEPPSLVEVRHQVRRFRHMLRYQDYAQLISELNDLIPLVGAAYHSRPSSDWTIVRTELYQIAARALVATNHPEAAWVAMDRGVFLSTAPRENSDYWLSILLGLAEIHATSRHLEWAVATARNVLDAGRHFVAQPTPPIGHLVVVGAAHLFLAEIEASLGNSSRASANLDEAAQLVDRMPPGQHASYGYSFGASTLALSRIAVAVTEGHFGEALDSASTLEPSGLPSDSHRAVLAIQLALAHIGQDDMVTALDQLTYADRVDPYEVATNPAARRAIGQIALRRSGEARIPAALQALLERLHES